MKKFLIAFLFLFITTSAYSQKIERSKMIFENTVVMEDTIYFISADETDTVKLVFPNVTGSAGRIVKWGAAAGTVVTSATAPLSIDATTGVISTSGSGSDGYWGEGTFGTNDSIIFTGTGCADTWSGSVVFVGKTPVPIGPSIEFLNDGRIIISCAAVGVTGYKVYWIARAQNYP